MVFDNPPATELIMIPGVQTLEKGGELNNPVVAVERLGPEAAPVILIFTGLSLGAQVKFRPLFDFVSKDFIVLHHW